MSIGSLADIPPGTAFSSRKELFDARVHRALQAGIVGRGAEGAESIVLSGGYIDDEDLGDVVIYTGQGGRDPSSGRQIADQEFTRGNQALVTSCLRGRPVRVIRGSRHKGPVSPTEGYRYDGLFHVESYWTEDGEDGFRICRFRLVAEDALISPSDDQEAQSSGDADATRRVETIIQRIVRDTALGRKVKDLHDHTCQVCGTRLECVGGPYAEAAHIRPIGKPHDGPDDLSNLLCLCPNHHVLLDRGAVFVDDNYTVQPLDVPLRTVKSHTVALAHIRYHRSIWA